MTIPSSLLGVEKGVFVDLSAQGIEVSQAYTLGDVIRVILDHANKNPGDPAGEKSADRLGASLVIPLRTTFAQQIASTKNNATKKLLGEELAMAGFGRNEVIMREKLERLLEGVME